MGNGSGGGETKRSLHPTTRVGFKWYQILQAEICSPTILFRDRVYKSHTCLAIKEVQQVDSEIVEGENRE